MLPAMLKAAFRQGKCKAAIPLSASGRIKCRALTAADIMEAYTKINLVSRSFASFFAAFDIWLTPTMADVAPPLGYLNSSSPDVDLLIQRFSEPPHGGFFVARPGKMAPSAAPAATPMAARTRG